MSPSEAFVPLRADRAGRRRSEAERSGPGAQKPRAGRQKLVSGALTACRPEQPSSPSKWKCTEVGETLDASFPFKGFADLFESSH